MGRPGRRAELREHVRRPLAPVWPERKLHDLAAELTELAGTIAAADSEAARASSPAAADAARGRAFRLRRQRLRAVAVLYGGGSLRGCLTIGARLSAWAVGRTGGEVDDLAAALSPLPLDDEGDDRRAA